MPCTTILVGAKASNDGSTMIASSTLAPMFNSGGLILSIMNGRF